MASRTLVAELYKQGHSNKEIADMLSLHHSTVVSHLNNAGVRRRTKTADEKSLLMVQEMLAKEYDQEAEEFRHQRFHTDLCPICKKHPTKGKVCWNCSLVL